MPVATKGTAEESPPQGAALSGLPGKDVLRVLKTSTGGLDAGEAAARLPRHGPNLLVRPPRPPLWRRLVKQFKDLFAIVMLGASVLSTLSGSREITAAILAVVLLNAVVAFVQEYRAERAIEVLTRLLPRRARVIRNGQERTGGSGAGPRLPRPHGNAGRAPA